MPLDPHSHLVAQGWAGKGTGLRHGAISRPLAIPQKRTLAGVGKDRDEAFPFWDHLFSAAAKSIQVKCLSDDEDYGEGTSTSENINLKRTSTGILSTRRPVQGTPAHSGTTTPAGTDSGSQTPRLSLLAQAKRDAARKGLYSRFFRGPVLGPESIAEEERRLEALILKALEDQDSKVKSVKVTEHIEVQLEDATLAVDLEVSKFKSSKKRKAREEDEGVKEDEDRAARKERKRQRKEEKEAKKLKEREELEKKKNKEREEKDKKEKKDKKDKKGKSKAVEESMDMQTPESSKAKKVKSSKDEESSADDSEEERKRRKRAKKEKKRVKARHEQEESQADTQEEEDLHQKDVVEKESTKDLKERSYKTKDDLGKTTSEEVDRKDKKKKKKRKREGNPDE